MDINGKDMIHKMAEFWASRAQFNSSTGFYDINGVMPPDEDHVNVNNSAFTNVVAGYSIYLAQYVACLTGDQSQEEEANEWGEIAWRLKLPLDEVNQYHPEFDGYDLGTEIKQADVVLLGFPIQYPMSEAVRSKDLEVYENVTRSTGPAMTWSMHAIGRMELNNWESAEGLFNRSYQPYLTQPFKVWTEEAYPGQGAVNFLTGMGGFLQAIISGYLGLRIQLQQLDFKPNLPPATENFTVSGLNYLGNSFTVSVQKDTTILELTESAESHPLVLVQEGSSMIILQNNIPVSLTTNKTFTLVSKNLQTCPPPPSTIGQKGPTPWKESISVKTL